MTSPRPLDFSMVRDVMQAIRRRFTKSDLVSASFDSQGNLQFTVVRLTLQGPAKYDYTYAMVFDSPDDYAAEPQALIDQFVAAAEAHFANTKARRQTASVLANPASRS